MEQKDIMQVIGKAEVELKTCFNYLMDFKHGEFSSADVILDFQPRLANCLYTVMQEYQKLCQNERIHISKKSIYTREEFSLIMSSLAKCKNALKQVIEIGKAMGDGFAWFFYRNNFDELDKQMEHKGTGLFPAGIGGRGEVQFIKHNQNIDGLFTLYHSITNMLKIGDFSLCTIDGGVHGIGELKSKQNDQKLIVKAYISSKVDIDIRSQESNSDEPFDFERLKRQLKQQDSLLQKGIKSDRKAELMGDYQYDLIEEALINDKKISISRDKSMFVYCNVKDLKLADLLLNDEYKQNEEHGVKVDAIQSAAEEIINNDFKYNGFQICEVDMRMMPFRKPIIWWDLEDYIIEMIIFKRLQIVTITNIGAFYDLLEKHGYVIQKSGKSETTFDIYKKVNNGKASFENQAMFSDLIYHDFMKMSTVVDSLNKMLNDLAKDVNKGNMKMIVHLHQHLFERPDER